MTNIEIMNQNRELSSDLITPLIDYNLDGTVQVSFKYNYIEIISMLSYTNRCFYEKNLHFQGGIIWDKDSEQYYLVYFDPMIYYENTNVKVNKLII
jgi:hypothetical protein